MRFQKGDKVEVMDKRNALVSWRVAEVLSGNGHTYCVQYPGLVCERTVETVSRKLVRPCPSPVQGVENCIIGDIVEVFYEQAWKIAAILKIMKAKKAVKGENFATAFHDRYLVRLLGCSQEMIIDRLNIRTRQTWHDEKWFPVGKISRVAEDVLASKPSISNCYLKINFHMGSAKTQHQTDCLINRDEVALRDSGRPSLKRIPQYESSVMKPNHKQIGNFGAVESNVKKQRLVVVEKEEAGAYGIENVMMSSGYRNHDEVRSSANVWDSDACSVGSCSIADQSRTSINVPFTRDTLCSDAESCYGCPPKEDVEFSIRRLELHAYHTTLEALYASGPLSWEQEAMLTNLRIMLRISNDEHLMELKQLISVR